MKNCERLDGTTKPVSTACTEFKTPPRAAVTSTPDPLILFRLWVKPF